MLCEKCKLKEVSFQVEDVIDVNAKILIIGDKPWKQNEVKMLNKYFEPYKKYGFCFTSLVKCNTRKNLSVREIQCCQDHLIEILEQMKNLQLIVLSGSVVFTNLTGLSKFRYFVGKLLKYKNYFLYPIYDTEAIFKNPDLMWVLIDNIENIEHLFQEYIMNKNSFYVSMKVLKAKQDFEECLKTVEQYKYFSLDIETTGFKVEDQIVCVGIGTPQKVFIIPQDLISELKNEIKYLFRTAKCIGHNGQFDFKFLFRLIPDLRIDYFWDTSLAEYLLNENYILNLKYLVFKYLNFGGYEFINQTQNENLSFEFPFSVNSKYLFDLRSLKTIGELIGEKYNDENFLPLIYEYCAKDAYAVLLIARKQLDLFMKESGLITVLKKILLPSSITLAKIENAGVWVDRKQLKASLKLASEEVEKLDNKIKNHERVKKLEEILNKPFNPDSVKQKILLFYGKNLFKNGKENDESLKKYPVDVYALEKLSATDSLAKLFINYSKAIKLKEMIKSFEDHIDKDGRLRSKYSLTATVSGRTSSSDINLQNIPFSKDVFDIRKIFSVPEGYKMVSFDYSQHELRVLANICAFDKKFCEDLEKDIHSEVASIIFNKPKDQISGTERSKAKTVVFGISYGMTEFGLSKTLKVSVEDAKNFIKNFFNSYRGIAKYMFMVKDFVQKHRFVRTLIGRKRRFWRFELSEKDYRAAINIPIQSTASDLFLYGMNSLQKFIDDNNLKSKIVMEIHDEIILEMPEDELKYIPKMKEILTDVSGLIDLIVPIKIEVEVGSSLGELLKVEKLENLENLKEMEEENANI